MRNNTENPWFGSVQYLSVTVQYFFDKKEKFQYFFVYLSVCLSSIHLYTQCIYVYMYKSIHIIFQSKRERKKTTIVINH